MKKSVLSLLAMLLLLSCTPFDAINRFSGVYFDSESQSLNLGESVQLPINVTPTRYSDDVSLSWESNNPSAVSVDSNGLLTAEGYGEATVTVTATYRENSFSANCLVNVPMVLSGVSLDREILTLHPDETANLQLTITPNELTGLAQIFWGSLNPSVVSVNENGQLTALDYGETTISVTVTYMGIQYGASCDVTVLEEDPEDVLTGVFLDKESLTLAVDGETTLNATVTPASLTENVTFYWSSNNTSVVLVFDGDVIAIGPGEAVVFVRASYQGIEFVTQCIVEVI